MPLTLWSVTLRVERICFVYDLSQDDQGNSLLRHGGTVPFLVRACDPDDAKDAAEEYFHDHVAIEVLDDFEITSTAAPLSAHERIAVEAQYPACGTERSVLEMGEATLGMPWSDA